jgi:hypothetical protein
MLLDIIRRAWAESPAQVILSVPLTIAAVVVGWAVLVVVLVMGGAS